MQADLQEVVGASGKAAERQGEIMANIQPIKITTENLLTLQRGDRFVFRATRPYSDDMFATVTNNSLPDEEAEEPGHLHFVEDAIPDTEFEFYYEELLAHADTTEILGSKHADVEALIAALPKRGRMLEARLA